jgi:hypothetical protein
MINQTRNNRALFGLRSFGISGTGFFICLTLLLARASASGQMTPGQITLSARGYKVHGRQRVDLSWNGATSNTIDVYRNGVLIATVSKIPGFYTDNIGARGKGTYIYRFCNAGTQNCSSQVPVKFGGGG